MSRKKVRRGRDSRPAEPPKAVASISAPRRGSGWLWGFLIVAATLGAYWPALHGDFVFDDRVWTTDVEHLLRDSSGLREIWTNPKALQQYYPVTGTSFWLDYQLWHWWTLPYHVENVLLHAAAALLLWRLLQKLEVPGAWLAGALFALHPVMVESTAWITERKNVLSMFFFLAALLAYGRFTSFWKEEESPARRGWFYALALVLFVGALLSKITAFALPAVLLLLCWWKRGRIRGKEDVLPTLPFFALSIGLGLGVAWLEKHHVGAQGADWDLSWPERILVAGRVPWFYLGKLLWPFHQSLIYPQWRLEAGSVLPWLFPLGSGAVLLSAWLLRGRLGRGPVVALFFFAGTLLPVLGLINFYWMRFSFVGDHLVYLSSAGLLALGAALVVRGAERLRQPLLPLGFALLVLPLLAVLTWREAGQYQDEETLWRTTISRNPACWMAHYNLGEAMREKGETDAAMLRYQRSIELKPDFAEAHNNLGTALLEKGRVDEAMILYRRALELKPDDAQACNNLGNALIRKGETSQAVGFYQKALEIDPTYAAAHNNVGIAYFQTGRVDEAVLHYRKALRLKPGYVEAHKNLGNALFEKGQTNEATAHYRTALELNPDFAEVHYDLGTASLKAGQLDAAKTQLERALELKPDYAEAHNNLGTTLLEKGLAREAAAHYEQAARINPKDPLALNNFAWILATSPEASLRDGARAVELAQRANQISGGNHPTFLQTLAAAYAESGRFAEADETAERALSLATAQGNYPLAEAIRSGRNLYQAGMPMRDSSPATTGAPPSVP